MKDFKQTKWINTLKVEGVTIKSSDSPQTYKKRWNDIGTIDHEKETVVYKYFLDPTKRQQKQIEYVAEQLGYEIVFKIQTLDEYLETTEKETL
tara:strand:+ start:396 stop:674 length:279 start_codon:yes stop_codon:yes gene_type:complete